LSVDITAKLLSESVGKSIFIKLKGDRKVRGILVKFDQHMNLVLENSTEYFNDTSQQLGNILLKGDSIIVISPEN